MLDQGLDHLEKVGICVGFIDVVLLVVKGDDKSDDVHGGTGSLFQLPVWCVLTEKDGLHCSKGLVSSSLGVVSEAH